jgi:hypothetical protein
MLISWSVRSMSLTLLSWAGIEIPLSLDAIVRGNMLWSGCWAVKRKKRNPNAQKRALNAKADQA